MPISKANQRAVNKYVRNNYDRINVTMPKGKKESIQAAAAAAGESVNAFINGAIEVRMGAGSPSEAAGGPEGGGGIPVLPGTLEAARRAAEAAGEALPAFVARAVSETAERDRLSRDS